MYSFSTDLPNLIIMYDNTIIHDYELAKEAALNIVDKLSGNQDMIIHNYTLVPIEDGIAYLLITF